jgi:glycosyltransferase involved in cell wall biosynthesis
MLFDNQKSIKVVFTLDALTNAGTEKSTVELLSKFSNKINCNCVYFSANHDLKKDFIRHNIPVYFLNAKGKFALLEGVLKFYKFISQEKPDIVVSSLYRANIISRVVCFLTNTPLVGTIVSDSYSKARFNNFGYKKSFKYLLVKTLDRVTSFIPTIWIANSNSIKLSGCSNLNIPTNKVIVLHRGRDVANFSSTKKFQFQSPFKFIFIGRLLYTKGIYDLLVAFKSLFSEQNTIELHIYGEGPERNEIQKQIMQYGLTNNVFLHGNKLEAWKALYDSCCFVFPSHYEGFSGSLIEAMMSGIPIISSDIPMNLEAVEHEKTAYVFQSKSIQDLEKAMKYVYYNYENAVEMGKRAKLDSINRFDIQKIAHTYEEILLLYAKSHSYKQI